MTKERRRKLEVAKPEQPWNAAIYLRQSSSRRRSRTGQINRELSRSISDQDSACRTDVERNDWNLWGVYTDKDRGASRYSKGERDEWNRLIADLETSPIDVVVTYESARNYRDLEVYVTLRKICRETDTKLMYNGRLFDLNDDDDAFMTGLDALADERTAGKTHKAVLTGVRSRAAAGRPHGRYLYGYRRVYDERTGEYIESVPDEVTGPIVDRVFTAFAGGTTAHTIARKLTAEAVATARGAKIWRAPTIIGIVGNPSYLGHRYLNGELVVENAWPALVDENTWWTCQARLTDPARKPRLDSSVKYLLSGIAICGGPLPDGGRCGGKMWRSSGGKHTNPLYICHDRSDVGRNQAALEEYVTEWVLSYIEDDERIGEVGPDPRIATLAAELEGLRGRLNAFTKSAASPDGISPSRLALIERELQPQIDAAERQMTGIRARTALPDLRGRSIREAWFLQEADGGLTLADKRAIISGNVTVTVLPVGRGRKTFNPDAVEILPI